MRIVRHMADDGETVVMVDHNFPQMLELADSLIVRRAGRIVATPAPKHTTLRDLTHVMVGSNV